LDSDRGSLQSGQQFLEPPNTAGTAHLGQQASLPFHHAKWKTTVLDWYYPPFGIGNWYGVTANYQMDGNYKQSPHSVYVDKFSLTYW
jgi:hypothetical protein